MKRSATEATAHRSSKAGSRTGAAWLAACVVACVAVTTPAAGQVALGLDAFHLSYLQSVTTTVATAEGPVNVEARPAGVSGLAPVVTLRRQKWQLAGRLMLATADVELRGGGNRVSDDRDDRSVVEAQLEVSRTLAAVAPGGTALSVLLAPSVAWWTPQDGAGQTVLGADAGLALDFGLHGRVAGVLRATVGIQGGTLSAEQDLGSGEPGRPTQFRTGISLGLRVRT